MVTADSSASMSMAENVPAELIIRSSSWKSKGSQLSFVHELVPTTLVTDRGVFSFPLSAKKFAISSSGPGVWLEDNDNRSGPWRLGGLDYVRLE